MKQELLDRRYMKMAVIWSENSYAIRRKVGALIVKDNSIISDGYNGTPSGFPNVCEYAVRDNKRLNTQNPNSLRTAAKIGCSLVTHPYVLHAEANAITKLAKSHNSSEGATIYVTDEPCLECSKLIIQAGIRRVVYLREYRLHDGVELLKQANIEVVRINENELNETNEEI